MRRAKHTSQEIEYLKANGLEKTITYIEHNYKERINELKTQRDIDIIRAKELNENLCKTMV